MALASEKTIFVKHGWIFKELQDDSGEIILSVFPEENFGIRMYFEFQGINKTNNKAIYNNITVIVDTHRCDNLSIYHEFLEYAKNADEVAQACYKYAVENDFWQL